jgi:anhydro-N-acetylmuramic acid kinase
MTNINAQKYDVIGLMSGTSLDGLDIAFCRFVVDKNKWSFSILNAETVHYSDSWTQKLSTAESLSALDFSALHNEFGLFLGQCVADFVKKYSIKPDFVSSHGHTIFHQPDKKITVQIGAGAAIASICRLPVTNDFRTLDVLLGGQGAPLVPIGDKLLFGAYDYCLNLGGFANISYEYNEKRIAYDICPVNIVLNYYANKLGQKFDKGGNFAKNGLVHSELLEKLNALSFFHLDKHQPKSLGKEWVVKNVFPLISTYNLSINDVLRTYCEHIVIQLSKTMESDSNKKLLITGGGAYNDFLVKLLKNKCKVELVIPEKNILEFKEALIFGFLGVLRMRNEVNCLSSVTGAPVDNCGGSIYTV